MPKPKSDVKILFSFSDKIADEKMVLAEISNLILDTLKNSCEEKKIKSSKKSLHTEVTDKII